MSTRKHHLLVISNVPDTPRYIARHGTQGMSIDILTDDYGRSFLLDEIAKTNKNRNKLGYLLKKLPLSELYTMYTRACPDGNPDKCQADSMLITVNVSKNQSVSRVISNLKSGGLKRWLLNERVKRNISKIPGGPIRQQPTGDVQTPREASPQFRTATISLDWESEAIRQLARRRSTQGRTESR